MASTVTPTASSSSQPLPAQEEESRPQAGPLPRKRGEIGYQEGMQAAQEENQPSDSNRVLPERHPADRPLESNAEPDQPRAPSPSPSTARSEVSSMRKPPNHACWPTWLGALDKQRYWGVTLVTIVRLPVQIIILVGTVVAWVFITKQISKDSKTSTTATGSETAASIGSSASIFVHVTFAITVLAQLIFLERGIFFLRAQRYAYLHPGSTRRRGANGTFHATNAMIAFAPWNRPSLPTYAVALAQSGVGTGDVEDNAIAIPPPPAYGHTRGSRLLLQGFMRNSLRLAARDSRASDALSLAELGERSQERADSPRDRPVSYRRTDPDWEERCDAERAMRLAETLETLERADSIPMR